MIVLNNGMRTSHNVNNKAHNSLSFDLLSFSNVLLYIWPRNVSRDNGVWGWGDNESKITSNEPMREERLVDAMLEEEMKEEEERERRRNGEREFWDENDGNRDEGLEELELGRDLTDHGIGDSFVRSSIVLLGALNALLCLSLGELISTNTSSFSSLSSRLLLVTDVSILAEPCHRNLMSWTESWEQIVEKASYCNRG